MSPVARKPTPAPMPIASTQMSTGRETVGKVTRTQLREIAEKKMKDLNANDIQGAINIILGSAKSVGIEVKG